MLYAQRHAEVHIKLFLFHAGLEEFGSESVMLLEDHHLVWFGTRFFLSILLLHDLEQVQLASQVVMPVSEHLCQVLYFFLIFELVPEQFEDPLASLQMLSPYYFLVICPEVGELGNICVFSVYPCKLSASDLFKHVMVEVTDFSLFQVDVLAEGVNVLHPCSCTPNQLFDAY